MSPQCLHTIPDLLFPVSASAAVTVLSALRIIIAPAIGIGLMSCFSHLSVTAPLTAWRARRSAARRLSG